MAGATLLRCHFDPGSRSGLQFGVSDARLGFLQPRFGLIALTHGCVGSGFRQRRHTCWRRRRHSATPDAR